MHRFSTPIIRLLAIFAIGCWLLPLSAATVDLPATLTFADHRWQRQDGTLFLHVSLKNIGDETAKNVTVDFQLPEGVRALSPAEQRFAAIPAGKVQAILLKLVEPTQAIKIFALATEGVTGQEVEGTFRYQPSIKRGAGGPDVFWVKPNPDQVGTSITVNKDVYDIQLKAISTSQLHAQNFTVYVNNTSQDGSKFEEGKLSTAPSRGPRKTHTYTGRLVLQPGVNKILIEVVDENGKAETRLIEINYNPTRSNLHVLAIGPSHQDLKYTAKDARDFAAAFANQKHRGLFKDVFVRTLVEPNNTDEIALKKALTDLRIQFMEDVEQKITKNDVVMVFISSHGKKYPDGSFKILTSKYDLKYPEYETIDYQDQLLRTLDAIECKKLVFIDACNSGAARGSKAGISDAAMARALHTLITSSPGLSTITSCKSNELSYEDKKWQNGAFTKAILSAFRGQTFHKNGQLIAPDPDGDGIITLGELRDYLVAYVPDLVKRDKPNAPTNQRPHVAADELDLDLPIYALRTYQHKNMQVTRDRPVADRYLSDPTPNVAAVNYTSTPTAPHSATLDSDGDGVTDNMDPCKDEFGPISNNGCPENTTTATGPESGQLVDERDEESYAWRRMPDGKKWMTENLRTATDEGSWVFGQKGKRGKLKNPQSGRLYDWHTAQRACPKGWRLPTRREWENLIKFYGGPRGAFEALSIGGGSGFDAQFAGIRQSNGTYCCDGQFGNYWTKEGDAASGYYFDFNQPSSKVEAQTFDKNTGLSCRCVAE